MLRVQGAGCRVQGAGCRVQGLGFRIHDWNDRLRHRLQDNLLQALEFSKILGCIVKVLGFRNSGPDSGSRATI